MSHNPRQLADSAYELQKIARELGSIQTRLHNLAFDAERAELPKYIAYEVKSGDTISGILQKYNISQNMISQVIGANYATLVRDWKHSYGDREFSPKNLGDHILPGTTLFLPIS
jgi:hypothetical protein